VGIINTLPPFLVSAYNAWLVFGKKPRSSDAPAARAGDDD
jgi:hypothetical protein